MQDGKFTISSERILYWDSFREKWYWYTLTSSSSESTISSVKDCYLRRFATNKWDPETRKETTMVKYMGKYFWVNTENDDLFYKKSKTWDRDSGPIESLNKKKFYLIALGGRGLIRDTQEWGRPWVIDYNSHKWGTPREV